MNLRYRYFQARDTDACVRLLKRYPEYSAQLLSDLPRLWQRLFDEQAMISCVVEDLDASAGAGVVAFGADVYVTDGFMAESRAAHEPYLTHRIIQQELCGRASPVLRRKAIARANGGPGLNAIIIHAASSDLSAYAIPHCLSQAFIASHRGYHLAEILQEVWDEPDRKWVQAYGALRGDYSDYYRNAGTPIPSYRPWLFGITAGEALAIPGSMASTVFLHRSPRFRFSKAAQELLITALDGETDTALAKALHISLPAVKMRWRAVYAHVESIAPELLPEPIRMAEGGRGREKRRCIVEYVRSHPEELRPFAASPDRTQRHNSEQPTLDNQPAG
jgi:hypothetical protein